VETVVNSGNEKLKSAENSNCKETWEQFLHYAKTQCSQTAYSNWLEPIQLLEGDAVQVSLRVPNVFVKEYLLSNYKTDLCAFLPVDKNGNPNIKFVIAQPEKQAQSPDTALKTKTNEAFSTFEPQLNLFYTFDNYIEGVSNQFVKSAALGVASRPGRSYNPLFIHGGVGLGKTHLLHSIGHHIRQNNKKLKVQCITTEAFINDLVDSLRSKTVDKMKRFYRNLDVLLVDDIQFLQCRQNFEEEFCNTFEALINQNKQIVITSDKPPGQLKLSERMIARMEWGLVAHVGTPDLETRVAILQHKAELKGLHIPNKIAFFIAEHIYSNVRQLEGAVNRLSAHSRLLDLELTEEFVENSLEELFQMIPISKISVEHILKSVATVFQVRVSDLKSALRTKEIALPRQVAMYLAKEMINESLIMLGASFGKTHSTILHAWKNIDKKLSEDDRLRRMVNMVKRNIES
jgi:chromosomal replication initiator protein